jgi:hypothetical protein
MPNIRYKFDWEVDEESGDCTARVTRSVLYGLQPNPAEESRFQVQIGKHIFSMYPWPGEKVFKTLPKLEYEKLSEVAKSFYAGTNKHKDFYYWELPQEDTLSTTSIINDPLTKKKKTKRNNYRIS